MPAAATPLSLLGHAHQLCITLHPSSRTLILKTVHSFYVCQLKAKMHAVKFALAALAATAVQASAIDSDEVFAVLLKRQEPGTPAYNCHDNCG